MVRRWSRVAQRTIFSKTVSNFQLKKSAIDTEKWWLIGPTSTKLVGHRKKRSISTKATADKLPTVARIIPFLRQKLSEMWLGYRNDYNLHITGNITVTSGPGAKKLGQSHFTFLLSIPFVKQRLRSKVSSFKFYSPMASRTLRSRFMKNNKNERKWCKNFAIVLNRL